MKLITVRYMGFTAMDRRFSTAMLPWIVSEIRKRDSREQISLGAEDGTLQAYNIDFELQFSHRIQDISRFSQADTDPCAFLYLVKDDNDRLLYCYMFQANLPTDVSDLYQQMRDQGATGPSLTSLCGDISPSSSHFFEVLYVGKIRVSHRKVPETFIDDALEKFKTHEVARRASYDSQASTDSSTDGQVSVTAGEEPGEHQDAAKKEGHHHDHNRTMVLQVGRTDLRLISPDRKQVLLHRQHKDVQACVQGAKSPEHFGFVCKEPNQAQNTQVQLAQQKEQQSQPTPHQSLYVGYIFKCESASVASDAVGAVSQAASAPATRSASIAVTTCEHCPMIWYHRLCSDVEGLGDRKTQATIFRRIEHLEDEEQASILTKFRGAETDSVRDQNEFLMMLLRAHCEMKQNRHVHDTAEQRSEFLSHYLGAGGGHNATGTIFMKAKRSLSSSFEHLLKRKGSRDDFGPHLPRDLSLPVVAGGVRESSPNSPTTPTPACDVPDAEGRRSRSSTIGSVNELSATLSPDRGQVDKSPKSPMMEIFMKVGNSPRQGPDESPRSRDTPGSWRQAIFNRVVTPQKNSNVPRESAAEGKPRQRRNSGDLKELWKRSIKQAILLVRMEKENARLRARQEVTAMKRVKLEYDEMYGDRGRESLELWDILAGGRCDPTVLLRAAGRGVPAARRGEVWQRLADMYCRTKAPFDTGTFPNYDVPYEELLKQLTSHQHAILIDLGRTFPNHPYYRSPLGPGQLSLFNLLKAYSLLDPEVGYCQGLSFVAGVLLLHMDEADAFYALRHLMFRRGLRAHYLPDMAALQVRLYQLSRLLHDRLPELYAHLDTHEVAPTLYAAPWLLTLFASQFPLGVVARVFDVLFVEGADVVFRVALALLTHHTDALLACDSFEQIMDFLKCRLPDIDAVLLDKVMGKALAASSEVAARLNEYRVEYQVLQEEAHASKPHLDELHLLRNENRALLERNTALAAQLEISLANVQRLERNRTLQQSAINRLEVQTRALEVSVVTLGTFIDDLVDKRVDINIPGDVRRIVAQLMVNERRKNDQRPAAHNALIKTISNSTQIFKRTETPAAAPGPKSAMVKSLSTGRIGGLPVLTAVANNRSVSLNANSDLERNLKNSKLAQGLLSLPDRGVPLRVIDDGQVELGDPPKPYPLKSTLSNPNLGAKVSNFFSNTHNHILRQHRSTVSPPLSPGAPQIIREESREELSLGAPPPHQIIREESREELSPTEETPPADRSAITLNLHQELNSPPTTVPSPQESIDSGVGTPVLSPQSTAVHPLSGCDVNFTFNGTTKLKTIRSIRHLSRNSSPDLLGK